MGFLGTRAKCVSALSLASTALAISSISEVDVSANPSPLLTVRDDDDPTDFGWVENWAAIGDSFTAGIGSGHQLGNLITDKASWDCSRYDYSWVKIVDNALGSSVKDFQFEACSGDRTGDIYEQVDKLNDDLDLVMMTAGGNDLCLGAMIKTCVILPWDGEDACQALIDKAQENIDTILKDNVRQILEKLDGKIRKDGALVYSGYAPFFNTENEDCSDSSKQNWALKAWKWWQFWKWLTSSLKLTIERREKFNKLVAGINTAISEVVEEIDADDSIGYRATFSDWSDWPEIMDGEFCNPVSTGRYPDDEQPDLLFIKFDTSVTTPVHDGLRRRGSDEGNETALTVDVAIPQAESDAAAVEAKAEAEQLAQHLEEYRDQLRGRLTREHIYDSLLWKSVNPRAEVLHKLDAREPAPPGCPGDGSPGVPLGLGLPDSFLSIFHPNTKGHEVMAAYALQNLAYIRAQILDVDDGVCAAARDEFTCWQKEGRKAFVDYKRVDENYKDFCNNHVEQPDNTINWKSEKTYHAGTPDEHTFKLQLSGGASAYDKEQCLESFDRIINSCDGNDDANPLNFKFGGSWALGNYEYQLNPKKDREMITDLDGTCRGWWKLVLTSYRIYGRGWATYDYGQETLLKSMRDCGSAVTGWKFEYCDDGCGQDGDDYYEWVAHFNLPVYGGVACMKNNWVPRKHGAEWTGEGSDKLGCPGAA